MRNDYTSGLVTGLLIGILLTLVYSVVSSVAAPANDVNLYDFDTYKSISSIQLREITSVDDSGLEDFENEPENSEYFVSTSGALGTPYDWPEWLDEEPVYIESYLTESDESAVQLSRIEYHLSIISGGVILALCSVFIWFMILKPLKSFIVF